MNFLNDLNELKKKFSKIYFQEIDLWPGLAQYIYFYIYKQKIFEDNLFKHSLKLIFFKESFNIINEKKGKIFASYYTDRKDHHNYFLKCFSEFNKKEIMFLDLFTKNSTKKFNFPNLQILFYLLTKFKRSKSIFPKLSHYLFFLSYTYNKCVQIKTFKKIIDRISPSKYISFCCAELGEEAIITQLCNKKNIPTFSMQHGILLDYEPTHANRVTYDNMIADTLLLWGKFSKEIASKYIKNKDLVLVGNPLYTKISYKKKKSFGPKKCAVFFSQHLYSESNLELLKTIKRFSKKYPKIKFYLKFHPGDDLKKYNEELKEISLEIVDKNYDSNLLLKKSDFIILHNTTLYISALKYQIPIFRFKHGCSLDIGGPNDFFSDVSSLEKQFKSLFNQKKYSFLLSSYEDFYYFHFYQPKNQKISNYYKKIILESPHKNTY